jgi:hypothetical protein
MVTAAQTEQIKSWVGSCERTGHAPIKATLVLRSRLLGQVEGGTLNGRSISEVLVSANETSIQFEVPGIFQAKEIVRQFAGTMDANGRIQGRLSQDNGKYAICKLALL